MDKNWLIGKDNRIPWHYKEDLVYYKTSTFGKNVLMGDKTYESLIGYYKDKPLPYGKVFVATINDIDYPNVTMVRNIDEFMSSFNDELWVVGGRTIYALTLKYADNLYITHIDKAFDGDTYFPKFDLDSYKLVSSRISTENPELNFCKYERK